MNCGGSSDCRWGSCSDAGFDSWSSIQASTPMNLTRSASASVAPNVAWFRNWNASAVVTGGGGGGGGGSEPPPPELPPQPASPSISDTASEISLVFIVLSRSGERVRL